MRRTASTFAPSPLWSARSSTMRSILTGLVLAFSATAAAGKEPREAPVAFHACQHFFVGRVAPIVPNADRLASRALCYDAFAILHSGTTKTPVFVAQRLNRASLIAAKDHARTNRFFADARLPRAERAELDDYKHSGYDRGHMAPAADMPTAAAMAQSFSLANMVPQSRINNQRAWAGIEQATRKYIMRARGDVYVITGPVYAGQHQTIGAGKVAIPTHLFKLVYDEATGRSWAHWIENSDDARVGKPITYQELVRRTSIQFFPRSPP